METYRSLHGELALRTATPGDAAAISALIHELMPYMTLSPDGAGAQQFIGSMSAAAIGRYVADPAYRYWIADADGALAGVVAVRDNSHLFHLFVANAWQRHGFARRMWEAARLAAVAAGNPGYFTVNSSVYALAMYERFGFAATGPKVEQNGIAYVPMRLHAAS